MGKVQALVIAIGSQEGASDVICASYIYSDIL